MLVCKCEIEPVGEEADRELLARVPNGLAVVVIDKEGNLHPFRLSKAEVAKHVKESDFPIPTQAIKRVEAHSVVSYRGSNCILISSYGDGLILC